ncbi:pleiotropic drug resistance protein 3-like isoform X2 [Salvia miltiorrhiza]|uniref:pleiotropic drug resistance protein 3-like isoform X2 n=1 Tax=Salvia miltiorrhiza TaxID=226208 RepID=UPI0025ABDA22|nr:pleiotropic drug resistance protein 3-like isoform X2 [Salvia miltiorrhiza]
MHHHNLHDMDKCFPAAAVEVRYTQLRVEAECELVKGKPLPTLWNSLALGATRLVGLKSRETRINIIDDVSGVIKPGRMTLLLGPPGCGKTTFLKALSGNLSTSLKMTGEISYNGYNVQDFVAPKVSAYVGQYDRHIPEMTVRETLDFSGRCQGVGNRAEILMELIRREKHENIVPHPDVDAFMKANVVEGQKTSIQTDYNLKILGLDTCADTLVGDSMKRGISGGQKKRLTLGEMLVGPTNVFFMDEISNGLDSSTVYQIVSYLQQLAHVTDATIIVSLLQPAPEIYDLFDDIILMAEGKIVYQGSRDEVLEFFDSFGFKCPARKEVAGFLQEIISPKDQEQYWYKSQETYNYVSVHMFSRKFKESDHGCKLTEELSAPFYKSKSQNISFNVSAYSLKKWALFRTCMSRELLLMKRNSFIYVFKSVQLVILASITMTVFLRTQMSVDLLHANSYLGALFYSLIILVVDGIPELSMTVARLAVFYKQRDLHFYPAWAYAVPATILKIPLSLLESAVWTCFTYYTIGYSPQASRFFRQMMVFFAVHLTSISLCRFVAAVFQTMVVSATVGSIVMLYMFLLSGFIIPKSSMPIWLKWAFWISPLSYGEIGLSLNEFLAPRWQKQLSGNSTMGRQTLENRGLYFDGHFFWISLGAMLGFVLLFNTGFTLALSFLKPPGSRAIISIEKLSELRGKELVGEVHSQKQFGISSTSSRAKSHRGRVVLPFEPLSIVFQDVQYYVEPPKAMKKHIVSQKGLQLLHDITGAFKPGILTALMGVSGAGKTTLLDVLAGRKTSGTTEGVVKIGGYHKVQSTFSRISAYCEQTDIHSPQITVEESVIFSAWLRLDPQIHPKTKSDFVKEVLEIIELDGIKDALVGIPGVNGLSTEQRKRLTIAVELVANPSIIFVDEPTTGLDARAAAIVMRAVKNIADTGRTIVCTIHQPSIDIFEAFDELLLLKARGCMIYWGPMGRCSSKVIEYFEGISGVPKLKDGCNPATWMLEVTSASSEDELSIDFGEIYNKSTLHEDNKELVKRLGMPPSGSKDLHFPTRYAQTGWGQFKTCLWKQHWSYWRSPSYNLRRIIYMLNAAFLFGFLFWGQGQKLRDQQSLLTLLGSTYCSIIFSGIHNCQSVLSYISTERTVFYRERFAGMYASWAYSAAQVIIEIPYVFVQALIFTVITYPMIGYYLSAYKVFIYFYCIFCTLLYYTYLGMLVIAITPSFPVAATLQSAFYTTFNLFAGFFIPRPQIPKWWIWFYYVVPTSWSLNGILTSQYGDVEKEVTVFGETETVSGFLRKYFGFHHNMLPLVILVLTCYPILFASVFAYCIGKLNYQRR